MSQPNRCVVGVVNITDDSFSDGGRYFDPADALAHARRLHSQGADIVELGPASSHPDARRLTSDEERKRLAPVLTALVADGIPVSVDSYRVDTQRFALDEGAAYLKRHPRLPQPHPVLPAARRRLHARGDALDTKDRARHPGDPDAAWVSIERFFTDRLAALEAAGILRNRLVVDPGLGLFLGSNPEPSLAVLGSIGRLKSQHRP